jgi:hypothetical protein
METDVTWNPEGPSSQRSHLAKFVNEGHPAIAAIVADAEDALAEATRDPSFDAYVSGNPSRVEDQVRAIYESIRRLNLSYRQEPWNSRHTRQVIRRAEEVLDNKYGCCIDLVLLVAGALQFVGIHALILVVGDRRQPAHALLGYWVYETLPTARPRPVLDWQDLQPRLSDLRFVECTDLAEAPSRDYDTAVNDALTHLPPNRDRKVWYAVDVDACRELGIAPIASVALSNGFKRFKRVLAVAVCALLLAAEAPPHAAVPVQVPEPPPDPPAPIDLPAPVPTPRPPRDRELTPTAVPSPLEPPKTPDETGVNPPAERPKNTTPPMPVVSGTTPLTNGELPAAGTAKENASLSESNLAGDPALAAALIDSLRRVEDELASHADSLATLCKARGAERVRILEGRRLLDVSATLSEQAAWGRHLADALRANVLHSHPQLDVYYEALECLTGRGGKFSYCTKGGPYTSERAANWACDTADIRIKWKAAKDELQRLLPRP